MQHRFRLTSRRGSLVLFGALCAAAGFGGGLLAQARGSMVVVPYTDLRLKPVDPAHPDGTLIAVLWGDPDTGPSAMMMKMRQGKGVMHTHSSDYHLVLLQGTARHRPAGTEEQDAPLLPPGSYWFQPGEQAHADSCLTDECMMFITWSGKRDSRPTEPPAPTAKP